ncbi:MAG: ketoacyl-ACP synthase III [Planctomycetales bacterium]|nr:ketoacyl-ACP synthase III [Planctomycetales bacterium]
MALVTDSQKNPRKEGEGKQQMEATASTRRGPLSRITGVQLLGTGSCAPAREVPNEALAELGYDADWIVQRTGIQSRRHGEDCEATSDLAVQAGKLCLQAANARASEVDMIIVATMTPDTPTPSTACHVQRELGATAAAMDLNAACAGFMYALVTGMQFVQSGACRKVLVIGADMMSRTVNPADQKTYPLFGDGAGAVLLGPTESDCGLLSYCLGADGGGGELLCIPGGGTREPHSAETLSRGRQFLHMDGRAVFKWAVRTLQDSVDEVLQAAGLHICDLDLAVFHQANTRILDAAAESLGIPREKLFVNLDQYGNTSAASIPLALDEAVQQNRIQSGNHVLLAGFGAGLAWGAGVLKW